MAGDSEPQLRCVPFLGAKVPQLGIGLAALGRPGYINVGHDADLPDKSEDAMRQQSWTVLDAAWANGIRLFDCARGYGMAEEFLSSWLEARGVHPGEACVLSKWGYRYTAGWRVDTEGKPHEVKEHTLSNLITQAGETEEYLGKHLNLYQIHSATLESGVLTNGEVLDKLAALKAERGWRIGLTLSGTAQAITLRKALEIRGPDSRLLFDCVQATWNLLEQSVGPVLMEARQAGLDIVIKEAVANGQLTPRNESPKTAREMQLLREFAGRHGSTVDAVALACVMLQDFTPVVLSGAATVQHAEANFQALGLASRLSKAEVDELAAAIVQPPEEYWAARGSLSWN